MLGQGLAGPRTAWSPSQATYLSGFVICDTGLGKERPGENQESGKCGLPATHTPPLGHSDPGPAVGTGTARG